MGEIGSGGGSSYPTSLDTDTSQESTSTVARADVPNDLASAVVAIQTELGTDPAGTKTNVKTFLQTEHATNGTHGAITATSIVSSGNVTVNGGKVEWDVGTDEASATEIIPDGDGNFYDVTGTTTIAQIDDADTIWGVGSFLTLQFDGALTLTHSADLVLPHAADITTRAGDIATFYKYAAGDWRCINYSILPGTLVQTVYVQNGNVNTGTTQFPIDDSIPQNTEGDEYGTLAITPTHASNKLVIETAWHGATSSGDNVIFGALFQDTTANALATGWGSTEGSANQLTHIPITHEMVAGTTSETTFKVRAGTASAGTTTFNGASAGRFMGGTLASFIRITEHKV
jgi:hypothetical protein